MTPAQYLLCVIAVVALGTIHRVVRARAYARGRADGFDAGFKAGSVRQVPTRHSIWTDFLTLSEADQDGLWSQIGRAKRANDPNRREK